MKKATIKAVASIVGGLIVFTIAFLVFQSSPSTTQATMTQQEAEQLATEQFRGDVVSVELDDGRYEIEIVNDDAKYELKIDAKTGEILKLEEKVKRQQVAQNNQESNSDVETDKDQKEVTQDKEEVTQDNNKVSKDNKKEQKPEVKEEPKVDQKQDKVTKKEPTKTEPKVTEKKPTQNNKKQSSNVMISNDEAIAIARKQVPNATIIEFELDSDDGRRYYEIEMHTSDQEVEIEIDAYTGEVIVYKIEQRDDRPKGSNNIISLEEAKRIALAKEPNGVIKEAELDEDDGRYYYEIEMKAGRYEVEIEIDAKTGNIIDIEYDD